MENTDLSKNISILADGILKVIEITKPYEWGEWDSWAGKMIYRRQPLRDAQKEAIVRFLTSVLEREADGK